MKRHKIIQNRHNQRFAGAFVAREAPYVIQRLGPVRSKTLAGLSCPSKFQLSIFFELALHGTAQHITVESIGKMKEYPEVIVKLSSAMIRQAVTDVQYLHCIHGQELQAWCDAVKWIKTTGPEADDWPLSFKGCCEVLGIDHRRARERLLAMAYSAVKEI